MPKKKIETEESFDDAPIKKLYERLLIISDKVREDIKDLDRAMREYIAEHALMAMYSSNGLKANFKKVGRRWRAHTFNSAFFWNYDQYLTPNEIDEAGRQTQSAFELLEIDPTVNLFRATLQGVFRKFMKAKGYVWIGKREAEEKGLKPGWHHMVTEKPFEESEYEDSWEV